MATERKLPDTVTVQLRRPDFGWWIVGLVLLTVVAWMGFQYLGWVVLGLFTYYVARPIAHRINRRISSPTLDAGLTLAFIIIPILLFIAAFLTVALGQAVDLLSSSVVTSFIDRLPIQTSGLPTDPVEVIVAILQDPTYSSVLDEFGVVVGTFTVTLFNVFLMLIFAFFLLVNDTKISRWFEKNVFGPESVAMSYLGAVDRGLTSVYFGYSLTIFAIIIIAAIIYGVFNLVAPGDLEIPSVLLLAVVTGVFTLIPLVGRSIVYALITAVLSSQALSTDPSLIWVPIVFFVLMVLVFDNVVRTYIRPYLSGKSYNMALVMFAYLLGPALFGWYGIFMGPLLMVLIVEFITNILPRLSNVVPEGVESSRKGPDISPGEFEQVTFDESSDAGRDDARPG